MKQGDYINTPRFMTVKIAEVLTADEAREKGYTEPTYYESQEYSILGKHTGINLMVFAAVKKQKECEYDV